MQPPAVSRASLKRAIAAQFILLPALLAIVSITAHATPSPVAINFDNLGPGVVVSTQYNPQVIFSSPTGYYGYTIYTAQAYRSAPRSITSRFNNCDPFTVCVPGDIYLHFPTPVKNFSFYVFGSVSTWHLFYADVYVGGAFYGTYEALGNGQPSVPILFDKLKGLANVTDVLIYYASNVDAAGWQHELYYDDFNFTPNFDVNITSGRVSGILNSTTKYALLGADVALNASVASSPALTGGAFSWSTTGPSQQVSASNTSSSYTVRWTETGIHQAKVIYTRNGFTATSFVNVNVQAPTLTGFSATQEVDLLGRGGLCGQGSYVWSLGCAVFPGGEGMRFTASAQVAAVQYLSDPAKSGIKYVQAVSTLRKVKAESGSIYCHTGRTGEGEADVDSGWRLDDDVDGSGDPYESDADSVRYFSEGNSLAIETKDSPSLGFDALDAVMIDDRFQMYVVYFAGGTPSAPSFQRRLGSLTWRWGGQLVYDINVPTVPYRKQSSFGRTGSWAKDPVTSTTAYVGRNSGLTFTTCPWGPAPVQNPIDGSTFFVRQQYRDVLKREPDQSGWNYWRSYIAGCGFDAACIPAMRLYVAWGFINGPEFRQTDPGLAHPPGTPGFDPAVYNPAFVRQLYITYLLREPEPAGMAYYLDRLSRDGNYDAVLAGFINSPEYRSRFGPP